MATNVTGQNFIRLSIASLIGSAVAALGQVLRMNPSNAAQVVTGGNGALLDKVTFDASTDASAKHGAASVALTGTTPVTVDLTDLTSNTASNDGDSTFASFNKLVFKNLGAGSVTIAPGGSNPANLGITGTTPAVTVPPGGTFAIDYAAAQTVDSTHKTILITPAATTVASFSVFGA